MKTEQAWAERLFDAISRWLQGSRYWWWGTVFGVILALALGLSGCGTDRPQPVDLGVDPAQAKARLVWQQSLSDSAQPVAWGVMQAQPDWLWVTQENGQLSFLHAQTGRKSAPVPVFDTEITLSTAPVRLSTDAAHVRVVLGVTKSSAQGAQLVMRSVQNKSAKSDDPQWQAGAVLWRLPLTQQVYTPPIIAGDRAFILLADRSLMALDAQTGAQLWIKPANAGAADALTLKAAGVLTAVRNTLVVGQGGRLLGIDPDTGVTRWDVVIGSPRGTNDVERLADLVGPAARLGEVLCVRSFQTAIGCVNVLQGQLLWRKSDVGHRALLIDKEQVIGTDSDGRISAWRRNDGERIWASDTLRHHDLSAAQHHQQSLAFTNAQGQQFWLDSHNGQLLHWHSLAPARVESLEGQALTSVKPVSQVILPSLTMGRMLLQMNQAGHLFAYTLDCCLVGSD